MSAELVAVRIDLPAGPDDEAAARVAPLRADLAAFAPDLLVGGGRTASVAWVLAPGRDALETVLQACALALQPSHVAWGVGRLLSERRREGAPSSAPWAMPVTFAAPVAELDDLDDLYELEHVPALLGTPAWHGVRRYAILESGGEDWTRLAIHDVAAAGALADPAVAASVELPRYRRLAARPWFASRARPLRRL